MTTIASLDFDALTPDTSLTPSPPWSTVGDAPALLAASAYHGALGINWPSTSASSRLQYDFGSPWTSARVLSFYVRLGTLPTATQFIASALSSALADQGGLRMTVTGALSMRNGGSSAGSSFTMSAATWYRVEWRVDPSVDQQSMRIYAGNSTTPLSSIGPVAWSSDTASVFTVGPRTGNEDVNFDYDSIVIADDWTGPFAGSPLAVDAGSDIAAEFGDNVSLAATVVGGTTPYTRVWTVEDGAGTFDDDNIEDPVFTPTQAGVHVLRLTVTDNVAATDFDEVTLTITGSVSPVAASGWATIVGGSANRLAAISDGSNATYVETGPDPVDDPFTMTFPPLLPPAGDFLAHVTLSLDVGAATVTPELYAADGTTLVSTADPITVTTAPVDYEVTFDAAEIAAAALDPEDDWGTGMVVVYVAEV